MMDLLLFTTLVSFVLTFPPSFDGFLGSHTLTTIHGTTARAVPAPHLRDDNFGCLRQRASLLEPPSYSTESSELGCSCVALSSKPCLSARNRSPSTANRLSLSGLSHDPWATHSPRTSVHRLIRLGCFSFASSHPTDGIVRSLLDNYPLQPAVTLSNPSE